MEYVVFVVVVVVVVDVAAYEHLLELVVDASLWLELAELSEVGRERRRDHTQRQRAEERRHVVDECRPLSVAVVVVVVSVHIAKHALVEHERSADQLLCLELALDQLGLVDGVDELLLVQTSRRRTLVAERLHSCGQSIGASLTRLA